MKTHLLEVAGICWKFCTAMHPHAHKIYILCACGCTPFSSQPRTCCKFQSKPVRLAATWQAMVRDVMYCTLCCVLYLPCCKVPYFVGICCMLYSAVIFNTVLCFILLHCVFLCCVAVFSVLVICFAGFCCVVM